jgi:hypothetical protein
MVGSRATQITGWEPLVYANGPVHSNRAGTYIYQFELLLIQPETGRQAAINKIKSRTAITDSSVALSDC